MSKTPTPILYVFFLAIFSNLDLIAANWPQFRGPQACGLDTNATAPVTWDVEKHENIRWEAAVPGLAHSSPIVWGDRVYVTSAVRPGKAELKVGLYGDIKSAADTDSHQWRLLAFDKATGKPVWDKLGYEGSPRTKRHPKSSHCSSTPATDGKRIVAIFGSEGLFCFDMNGNVVWKKDLGPMDSAFFAVPSAQWGFASSPVIYEDKVVVLCDVLTNSFLAVYSLSDGKELWKTPRNDVPTWGTPTITRVGDQTQILVNGWHHIGAYDFANGKEVWKLDGGGDIPVPTPIVGDGLAYFTSGHGKYRPIRGIRLDSKGEITPENVLKPNSSIAWVESHGNYMQTPILIGGQVFACFDTGVLTCLDAKDGRSAFSERIGSGSEGFTASPVSDGRHLYVTSEQGNVYVADVSTVSTNLSIIATNALGETCMASPAICDGTLFFRAREHLIAVGK
jgi:outer membrane protein assembly factor BamB